MVPVRPAPPPPGQHHRHSHNPLDALNAMWNRFSNSHHHPPPNIPQQHQPTPEILTVRAAMPILPHHYAGENEHIGPVSSNFASRYEDPPEIVNRLPLRNDSYKRSTQVPPIIPEHRRLNADSSSSDEASNPPKSNALTRPSKAPPPPPIRQPVSILKLQSNNINNF